MSLIAGTVVSLPVSREVSPFGFFLTTGSEDVLLHYTELTRDIKIGETLEVFVFFDTEDRLAVTMKKPYLMLGEMARLVVADVHPRLGCFLEMGLGRQLLLPIRELPELEELRPQVGMKSLSSWNMISKDVCVPNWPGNVNFHHWLSMRQLHG